MISNGTEPYSTLFGILGAYNGGKVGIAMDPIINRLLDDLPDKPPRSKLYPHADVIAALRRKRQTYREIAQFFREHLSITVSPSTIHDFVRVRRGRGKRIIDSAQRPIPRQPRGVPLKATGNLRVADEDTQERIAALKRRTSAEESQPVFMYEEDEPLKLNRKPPSAKTD